jgi:hypothetical protein
MLANSILKSTNPLSMAIFDPCINSLFIYEIVAHGDIMFTSCFE